MRPVWLVAMLAVALVSPAAALGPIFGWQRPLNTDALFDDSLASWREDWAPRIVTDKRGTWLAIWEGDYGVSPFVGEDPRIEADVLVARSTNGVTWSAPVPVNTDAAGDARFDLWPTLATDGAGVWVATWQTRRTFLFGPGEVSATCTPPARRTMGPPGRLRCRSA